MTGGPSKAGVVSIESVQGPSSDQGSASSTQAPKHRRLLRVVDDDEEEEVAAPDLVHKPRSRPEVVLAPSARPAEDPPVAQAPDEQARPD